MKIISWNVNGIRSAIKQGFWESIKTENPDIICLQEVKIDEHAFSNLSLPPQYHHAQNFALKKGYSGVAVFYKKTLIPQILSSNFGIDRFNKEGRYFELDFGSFILINIYLPHGGRQKENLDYKLEVYQKIINRLKLLKNKNVIVIGDFNIAHTELDLARPKSNKNNIMFTAKERSQIDKIINLGYVDSFRQFHQGGGHYTWWPWLKNCRTRNIGWRIDYAFVSRGLAPKITAADILSKITGSDHCPIKIALKITL